MRKSNYDMMAEQVRELFLQYDQQTMIDKFNLRYDAEYLYPVLLGTEYRINRRNGKVTYLTETDEQPAGYNEVMSIFDMLCYSGDRPVSLSGSWESMGNLSGIKGGIRKDGSILNSSAEFFSGKTEELIRAGIELGGTPGEKGDVSFIFPVFDFFPVYFQFWEADDEFPAHISFFMDKNALQFVHYETLWFMLLFLVGRLRE
ncbi:MAG: DUF3786 domain-containing protein, partial [Lachnospiraceae bacterium]